MTESLYNSNSHSENGRIVKISAEEIRGMQVGDEKVWSSVVSKWNSVLESIATRYVGPNDASDVVNAAWAAVYSRLQNPEFKPNEFLGKYIYQIVVHNALHTLEKNARGSIPVGLSLEGVADSHVVDPAEQVITRVTAQNILSNLSRSGNQNAAQAFFLQAHGIKVNEIARAQGVSEETVRRRKVAARKLIK